MAGSSRQVILVSASIGAVQRVAQVLGTLAVMPLVLTALGQEAFGVWGAVTSLVWAARLADLGTGYPTITHVARAIGRGDRPQARDFVTEAMTVTLLPAILGLILAFIILRSDIAYAGLFAIAVGALGLNAPLIVANSVWTGLHKTYIGNAWDLVQAIAAVALVAAAALSRAGLTASVGAVFAAMLLANLASTLHLLFTQPDMRPHWSRSTRKVIGIMMRERGMYLALMVSNLLAIWLDNVIALHMLGERQSAVISVALRVGMGGMAVLDTLVSPLWPAFAEAEARGDGVSSRRLLLGGTIAVTGAAFLGAAVVVGLGDRLMSLWLGDRLTVSADVLWALAAWLVVQAMGKTASIFFNARSDVLFQLVLALAYGAVAVAAKFLLLGSLGAAGILWGTVVAFALVVLPLYCWRISGKLAVRRRDI